MAGRPRLDRSPPPAPLQDHSQDVFLASTEGNREGFLTPPQKADPFWREDNSFMWKVGRKSLLTHALKEGQGLQRAEKGRVQLKGEWGSASGEQESARQR